MTPRDEAKVRKQLLADCRRPEFARLARYTKEVEAGSGEMVTRASIHFVKAALARWGNVKTASAIISDTPQARVVRYVLADLETGNEHSKDLLLEKEVERKRVAPRETVLRTRDTVAGRLMVVAATEDDLAAKEGERGAVMLRQLGLLILPTDLVAECMDVVAATVGDTAAPAAPEKKEDSRTAALVQKLKQRKGRKK